MLLLDTYYRAQFLNKWWHWYTSRLSTFHYPPLFDIVDNKRRGLKTLLCRFHSWSYQESESHTPTPDFCAPSKKKTIFHFLPCLRLEKTDISSSHILISHFLSSHNQKVNPEVPIHIKFSQDRISQRRINNNFFLLHFLRSEYRIILSEFCGSQGTQHSASQKSRMSND